MDTGKEKRNSRSTSIVALTAIYLLCAAFILAVLFLFSSCTSAPRLATHEQIVADLPAIIAMEHAFDILLDRAARFSKLTSPEQKAAIKVHLDIYYAYYHAAYDFLKNNELDFYYDVLERMAAEIEMMHEIIDGTREPGDYQQTPSGWCDPSGGVASTKCITF